MKHVYVVTWSNGSVMFKRDFDTIEEREKFIHGLHPTYLKIYENDVII